MERREPACQDNFCFRCGLRNRTLRQIQCLDQFHGLLSAAFLHDKYSTLQSHTESRVVNESVQPCQCGEHCCLPPMQRRSSVDQPGRVAAVIKIAAAILHILNRPLRYLKRERFVPRITIIKENEG